MIRRTAPHSASVSEIRRFSGLWAFMAVLAGGLLRWRGHEAAARALWCAAGLVGFVGMIAPSGARWFYRLWMALAAGINFLITRLLLALIFYGVLTPLALVFKLTGRDALRLKRRPGENSYWKDHDKLPDPTYYRHLY